MIVLLRRVSLPLIKKSITWFGTLSEGSNSIEVRSARSSDDCGTIKHPDESPEWSLKVSVCKMLNKMRDETQIWPYFSFYSGNHFTDRFAGFTSYTLTAWDCLLGAFCKWMRGSCWRGYSFGLSSNISILWMNSSLHQNQRPATF